MAISALIADPVEMTRAAEIDPITVEVVRYTVTSICDEMEANLTRTAFSPIVYEAKDFCAALLDPEGRLIAQARGSLPVFLCDLGLAIQDILRHYDRDKIDPGDIFVSNDPTVFGQHLNNVVITLPIFYEGGLTAFASVRAHWIDVGGIKPISGGIDTTEIYQEGIQIPTLKLFKRGELDDEIWRTVALNIRLPEDVFGDMQAQASACKLAERRYLELVKKYGRDVVGHCIERIWEQSEKRMREGIEAIPDGVYEAESFLDEDGVRENVEVPLRVRVIVRGPEVTVDYSDISPQVPGPLNSSGVSGMAVARIALKALIAPLEPANEGEFRPIHVVLPAGKLISARRPAPLARWSPALASLIDTILKALHMAVPERIPAGSRNDVGGVWIHGTDPNGRLWYYSASCSGGWGALPYADGACGLKSLNHGDSYIKAVEIMEATSPILVEKEELRQDSAGAGKFRGGLGTTRVFRVLKDGVGNFVMQRGKCPPWGLAGGKAGAGDVFRVQVPGQSEFETTRVKEIPLPVDSRLSVLTAGGGGWGDPLTRNIEVVELDARRGYISLDKALEDYGVYIDPSTGKGKRRLT